MQRGWSGWLPQSDTLVGSCWGALSCHHQLQASRPSLRIDATRRVRLPQSDTLVGSCWSAPSCHHLLQALRPSLRVDATRGVQGLRPLLGWCSTPGIFAAGLASSPPVLAAGWQDLRPPLGWCSTPGIFALLTGVGLPGFFAPAGPAEPTFAADNQPSLPCCGADSGYRREATRPISVTQTWTVL